MALMEMQDGNSVPTMKVHFGYTDGISQTTLHGGPERYPPDHQKPCEPWLFVLLDEAENYFVPEPRALGRNGSFAVFKMIETAGASEGTDQSLRDAYGLRASVGQRLVLPNPGVAERAGAPPQHPQYGLRSFERLRIKLLPIAPYARRTRYPESRYIRSIRRFPADGNTKFASSPLSTRSFSIERLCQPPRRRPARTMCGGRWVLALRPV
jgi:hypothetical protein